MKHGNWLIGACCVLFVAVIVTPTGVYDGVWKLATGREAAAWAQAIGSLLAVVVAIGIASWEALRSSRSVKAARLEARKSVAALAEKALEIIEREAKTIETDPEPYASGDPDASSLSDIGHALSKFDPSKLDSANGVIAFVAIGRACGRLPDIATAVTKDIINHGAVSAQTDEEVDGWVRQSRHAADVLRRLAG